MGEPFDLVEVLQQQGYRVKVITVPTDVTEWSDEYSSDLEDIIPLRTSLTVDLLACIASLSVMTMWKQYNANGYHSWWSKRMTQLSTMFAVGVDKMNKYFFNIDNRRQMYTTINKYEHTRITLFRKILTCVYSKPNIHTKAMKVAVNLSRGVGLTHLILIDNFIISPEYKVFEMGFLRGEISNIILAFKLLSTNVERLYFSKLLYTNEQNDLLNRQKFMYSTATALYIGKKKYPSLNNYNPAILNLLSDADKAEIDRLTNTAMSTQPLVSEKEDSVLTSNDANKKI